MLPCDRREIAWRQLTQTLYRLRVFRRRLGECEAAPIAFQQCRGLCRQQVVEAHLQVEPAQRNRVELVHQVSGHNEDAGERFHPDQHFIAHRDLPRMACVATQLQEAVDFVDQEHGVFALGPAKRRGNVFLAVTDPLRHQIGGAHQQQWPAEIVGKPTRVGRLAGPGRAVQAQQARAAFNPAARATTSTSAFSRLASYSAGSRRASPWRNGRPATSTIRRRRRDTADLTRYARTRLHQYVRRSLHPAF